MKKLSVVVPCRNEEACIKLFADEIFALGLENPLELVFVDDGSRDATLAEIKTLSAHDSRIRYVSFSRNFGKEAALYAGLKAASGDLVVTMDADLQHDPKLLPEMIAAVEGEGYDSAAACRTTRTGEPRLRSWFAHRFYSLMGRYSEATIRDGAMDYRLMTRQVVDAVLSLSEVNRFTKGIYAWVGFKTKWLECANRPRATGETKWSFAELVTYSLKGILSFTTAPLKLASVLGFATTLGAFVYMFYLFGMWVVCGVPVSGWPTIICAVLLLGGLQLFVIGILGLYLAEIFREAKGRPIYVVREAN